VHHPRTRRQRRERRVTKGHWVLEKFDADHAQQVPKPPAPKPGLPPGDLPPVPDPAPPPIENPGDAPLPPITDPDVIEPGEPNPARTPMRVRGAKRSPESFAASLSMFKAGTVTRAEQLILKYGVRTFMMEANLADPSTQTASPQVHP
jgi:hypothetical protein